MSATLDAAWLQAGWGPRRGRPVADQDPPLLFSSRWPRAWQVDELRTGRELRAGRELRPGREVAPAGDSPLGRLAAWDRVPAAIVTQRVRLALPVPGDDGGSSVVLLGALSVSLADVGELPPAAELGFDAQTVTGAHYPGVRVRSVRAATVGDAGVAVEMRVVRFMLTTPHGLLVLAFSAVQPDFYDVMEAMFDAVAQTARLDPVEAVSQTLQT